MAYRKRKARSAGRVARGSRRNSRGTARRPAKRRATARRRSSKRPARRTVTHHIVVETVAQNSVARGGRPASVREMSVKRKGQF